MSDLRCPFDTLGMQLLWMLASDDARIVADSLSRAPDEWIADNDGDGTTLTKTYELTNTRTGHVLWVANQAYALGLKSPNGGRLWGGVRMFGGPSRQLVFQAAKPLCRSSKAESVGLSALRVRP